MRKKYIRYYRCYICSKIIEAKDRTGIYSVEDRFDSPKKKFDLCKKCWRMVRYGLKKKKESIDKMNTKEI